MTHELPQSFRTAGIGCGIKSDPAILDLALFVSDRPATAAGVFTQNKVCGAPVKVSRERVPSTDVRAVVINSGNANACTGDRGLGDASRMTELVAQQIESEAQHVLVCSTGLIGHFLPMECLENGIPTVTAALGDNADGYANAAKAMMTTDTFHKQATRTVELNGRQVQISGAAKGAAMIGPNMATMLCVVMTDAELSAEIADTCLRDSVNQSFNCISVEGHTSTSDTVLLIANGAAETGPLADAELSRFKESLDEVTIELARAIIQDAEGADHLITIDVQGLQTREDAYKIAKTVADDALVKTAMTGADPAPT